MVAIELPLPRHQRAIQCTDPGVTGTGTSLARSEPVFFSTVWL